MAASFFGSRPRAQRTKKTSGAALMIAENSLAVSRLLRGTLVKGTRVSCRCIGPHGVSQMSRIIAFLKNDSGATAIEYGLIAAGISVVIIGAVQGVGASLNAKFGTVSTQLK